MRRVQVGAVGMKGSAIQGGGAPCRSDEDAVAPVASSPGVQGVTQQLWWYTVRATGLVAWMLVTASVVWGLLLSLRRTPSPRPAWMLDLHRFLGGLALLFVVAHVGALSFDTFVGFDWDDLLVPYASGWRPGAVAWGITAAYLLVAVEVTSLLMRRVRKRLWHAVHLLSYVVFVAVTVHALLAGADAEEPLVRIFAIASGALVALLTIGRVVARPAPRPGRDLALRRS
jgi:sulfoxide reductase heme-binding subunit YedZ